jgi:hypothetical protein
VSDELIQASEGRAQLADEIKLRASGAVADAAAATATAEEVEEPDYLDDEDEV